MARPNIRRRMLELEERDVVLGGKECDDCEASPSPYDYCSGSCGGVAVEEIPCNKSKNRCVLYCVDSPPVVKCEPKENA